MIARKLRCSEWSIACPAQRKLRGEVSWYRLQAQMQYMAGLVARCSDHACALHSANWEASNHSRALHPVQIERRVQLMSVTSTNAVHGWSCHVILPFAKRCAMHSVNHTRGVRILPSAKQCAVRRVRFSHKGWPGLYICTIYNRPVFALPAVYIIDVMSLSLLQCRIYSIYSVHS